MTEGTVRNAVTESKLQLAETIAKMAEGVMLTHGVIMPRDRRGRFETEVAEFINESPEIMQQIEQQIERSMNRPPAA